jgi:hypothetical protein
MTNAEINAKWERAAQLAEIIVFAWAYDNNKVEARRAQKELAEWLKTAREERLVYNGCYDEYITMHI